MSVWEKACLKCGRAYKDHEDLSECLAYLVEEVERVRPVVQAAIAFRELHRLASFNDVREKLLAEAGKFVGE